MWNSASLAINLRFMQGILLVSLRLEVLPEEGIVADDGFEEGLISLSDWVKVWLQGLTTVILWMAFLKGIEVLHPEMWIGKGSLYFSSRSASYFFFFPNRWKPYTVLNFACPNNHSVFVTGVVLASRRSISYVSSNNELKYPQREADNRLLHVQGSRDPDLWGWRWRLADRFRQQTDFCPERHGTISPPIFKNILINFTARQYIFSQRKVLVVLASILAWHRLFNCHSRSKCCAPKHCIGTVPPSINFFPLIFMRKFCSTSSMQYSFNGSSCVRWNSFSTPIIFFWFLGSLSCQKR